MATRAESLIRQFCFNRRNEIETEIKAARSKVPDHVEVKNLDKTTQGQIRRLRMLRRQADAIKALLTKQGFGSWELDNERSKLTNPNKAAAYEAINKARADRVAKLDKLQQTAYIQVMGLPPAGARAIVERLQQDLAKI